MPPSAGERRIAPGEMFSDARAAGSMPVSAAIL